MSFTPNQSLVWAEIPVSNLEAAMEFYAKAFGYELRINNEGPNPMADIVTADGMGTSGHLYPGKPAAKGTGPTVHLVVNGKVEDAIAAFNAAGGEAHDMVVDIPPGRFAYGTDPDGNSIGLFEPRAA